MKVSATTEKEPHREVKSSAETAGKSGASFFAPGSKHQQANLPAQDVAQLAKFKWENGGWTPIELGEEEIQLHEPPDIANEGDVFDDQTGKLTTGGFSEEPFFFEEEEFEFTGLITNESNQDIEKKVQEEKKVLTKEPVKKRKLEQLELKNKNKTSSSFFFKEEGEKEKKLKNEKEKEELVEKKPPYELGKELKDHKVAEPVKLFLANLSGKALGFYEFIKSQPTVTLKFELLEEIPGAQAITKLFVKIGSTFVNTEDDEAAIFNQWHLVNKNTPMQVTIFFDVSKNKNFVKTLENLVHEFTVHATYYREFIELILSTDNAQGEVGLEFFSNSSYEQYLSGYHQHHLHFEGSEKEVPDFKKDDPSKIEKKDYDTMKKKWLSMGAISGNKDFNEQVIRFAVLLKKQNKPVQDFLLKAKQDVLAHKKYKDPNPNTSGIEVNEKETSVVDESSIPPRPYSIDELLVILSKKEKQEIILGLDKEWINICELWLSYSDIAGNGFPGGVKPGEIEGRIFSFKEKLSSLEEKKIDLAKWLLYPGPENLGEAVLEHIALGGNISKHVKLLKDLPPKALFAYIEFRRAFAKATSTGGAWDKMAEIIEEILKEK